MPYEYRKLSPEERKEIVQSRKDQGYPPHGPPHIARVSGCFMISAACYEHAHILSTPQRRNEFQDRILSDLKNSEIGIDAWVILSNHYHLLIQTPAYDRIPAFIHRLHNGTSFEWNREDECSGKRKVWFQYFDRFIEAESQYFQTMNYIHYNPVKHGLVNNAYEWEWSSLGLYEEIEGREWLRKIWKKYTPAQTGFEIQE